MLLNSYFWREITNLGMARNTELICDEGGPVHSRKCGRHDLDIVLEHLTPLNARKC